MSGSCVWLVLCCVVGSVLSDGVITDGAGSYSNYANEVFNPACASGQTISFTVLQMEVECTWDTLYITDSIGNRLYSSNTNCANRPAQQVVVCPTSSAVVTFTSDGSVTYAGFNIVWTCMSSGTRTWSLSPSPSPSMSTGAVITSGVIELDAARYFNNLDDSFSVACPSDYDIKFDIVKMDVECSWDIVRIIQGNGRTIYTSSSYCNVTRSVTSSTSTAIVTFHTDSSVTKTGFEIHWECVVGSSDGSGLSSAAIGAIVGCALGIPICCCVACCVVLCCMQAKQKQNRTNQGGESGLPMATVSATAVTSGPSDGTTFTMNTTPAKVQPDIIPSAYSSYPTATDASAPYANTSQLYPSASTPAAPQISPIDSLVRNLENESSEFSRIDALTANVQSASPLSREQACRVVGCFGMTSTKTDAIKAIRGHLAPGVDVTDVVHDCFSSEFTRDMVLSGL